MQRSTAFLVAEDVGEVDARRETGQGGHEILLFTPHLPDPHAFRVGVAGGGKGAPVVPDLSVHPPHLPRPGWLFVVAPGPATRIPAPPSCPPPS